MAIISPLAYTIANGDPVDATPVQANLSHIVQDVNANAAPIAGSASQQFLVASTTNPAGAVPLAQAQSTFAALSGAAFSGSVSINTAPALLALKDTTSAQATPNKYLRSTAGELQVINSAYTASLLNLDDSGNLSVAGTVTGTQATSPAQMPTLAQTIGAGATSYTNFISSRNINTTYTNNTGRPLWVSIRFDVNIPSNTTYYSYLLLGGLTNGSMCTLSNYSSTTIDIIGGVACLVPIGSTYEFNANSTVNLDAWWEY